MVETIVISIITGIISGVISSVIVTQAYRIKDRERDRVRYFEEFHAFYKELCVLLWGSCDRNFVEKVKKIEQPKLYKWIHISKSDRGIVNEVESIYNKILHYAFEQNEEYYDLVISGQDMTEIEEIKIQLKYAPYYEQYRKPLEDIRDDVYCLEHPEARNLLKSIHGKN